MRKLAETATVDILLRWSWQHNIDDSSLCSLADLNVRPREPLTSSSLLLSLSFFSFMTPRSCENVTFPFSVHVSLSMSLVLSSSSILQQSEMRSWLSTAADFWELPFKDATWAKPHKVRRDFTTIDFFLFMRRQNLVNVDARILHRKMSPSTTSFLSPDIFSSISFLVGSEYTV